MIYHFKFNMAWLCLLLLGTGCSKDKDKMADPTGYDWSRHMPFTTSYSTFTMPFTTVYASLPAEKGTVALSEASGMAASVRNPGMLWAHNDSGNPNTLFLIDRESGRIVARYQVTGTANIDWEDMEISTDPASGKPYMYIGDTGDNDQRRPEYRVYRFEEPVFQPAHEGQILAVDTIPVDRIRFQYPDGNHDTETLFVDPVTRDIFLVTKSGVASTLYVLPYPQPLADMATAVKAGTFSFRQASAGTISPDGSRIMIKNRQEIYYWEKQGHETVTETLQRTPVKAPYAGEPQGEAVCFDASNDYYTLSEQASYPDFPLLYKYTKK